MALGLRGVSGGGSKALHETTLLQLEFRTPVPQRPVSAEEHHTRVEQRAAPPLFLLDSTTAACADGQIFNSQMFAPARAAPRHM